MEILRAMDVTMEAQGLKIVHGLLKDQKWQICITLMNDEKQDPNPDPHQNEMSDPDPL